MTQLTDMTDAVDSAPAEDPPAGPSHPWRETGAPDTFRARCCSLCRPDRTCRLWRWRRGRIQPRAKRVCHTYLGAIAAGCYW